MPTVKRNLTDEEYEIFQQLATFYNKWKVMQNTQEAWIACASEMETIVKSHNECSLVMELFVALYTVLSESTVH